MASSAKGSRKGGKSRKGGCLKEKIYRKCLLLDIISVLFLVMGFG